jgi:hypothetical protein
MCTCHNRCVSRYGCFMALCMLPSTFVSGYVCFCMCIYFCLCENVFILVYLYACVYKFACIYICIVTPSCCKIYIYIVTPSCCNKCSLADSSHGVSFIYIYLTPWLVAIYILQHDGVTIGGVWIANCSLHCTVR